MRTGALFLFPFRAIKCRGPNESTRDIPPADWPNKDGAHVTERLRGGGRTTASNCRPITPLTLTILGVLQIAKAMEDMTASLTSVWRPRVRCPQRATELRRRRCPGGGFLVLRSLITHGAKTVTRPSSVECTQDRPEVFTGGDRSSPRRRRGLPMVSAAVQWLRCAGPRLRESRRPSRALIYTRSPSSTTSPARRASRNSGGQPTAPRTTGRRGSPARWVPRASG